MSMYALSFYQFCGSDVELERIIGDEKAFPEFRLNHVAGRVKQGERALKIQETDSDDDDGETWTA